MNEICTDNRFEVIAAYKRDLLDGTNIETSPDEMAVIDNILFRFWQMGWLLPTPRTNADRIRSMTDEELSERFTVWEIKAYERMAREGGIFVSFDKKEIAADWLDWLKQEVKE